MNTFYKTIADYYDYIFPYNPKQLSFIENMVKNNQTDKILEIGCATANLTSALSGVYKNTYGIDLDESLLENANKKYSINNMKLKHCNMLNIESLFTPQSIDTVICFGNTLVHLNSLDEIEQFIKTASNVLKENGTLIIQTINYDRIINKQLNGLPTIDNDKVSFVRKYDYLKEINKIEFATELTIKSTDNVLKDSQQLYPLLKSEIDTILRKYFNNIGFYGNFNGDKFDIENSQPLIVVANEKSFG